MYYSLTVVNSGAVPDYADLTASNGIWGAVTFYRDVDGDGVYDAGLDILLADTKGPGPETPDLAPGQSVNILAGVTIPAGAADGEFHDTIVTATSGNTPAQSGSIVSQTWVINPLYAVIIGLKAAPVDGGIEVSWVTGFEMNNLGFNVYRRTGDGEWVRVNAGLIASTYAAVSGVRYAFLDSGAVAQDGLCYLLEDIDIMGRSSFHGPVSVNGTGTGTTGQTIGTTAGTTAPAVLPPRDLPYDRERCDRHGHRCGLPRGCGPYACHQRRHMARYHHAQGRTPGRTGRAGSPLCRHRP
ncbi:MAG: hypothetical protein ABIF71_06080 [Planctomycetota bacterium]